MEENKKLNYCPDNSIKISVCIPTYNRKYKVCDAIDSVLNQCSPATEIIVFDNCSNDGSFDYLKKKYGNKIILHKNSINVGPVNNWIYALEKSTSTYAKLLFSDDQLHNKYLSLARTALDINGNSIFFSHSNHEKLCCKISSKIKSIKPFYFIQNIFLKNKYPISPSMYVLPRSYMLESLKQKQPKIDLLGGLNTGAGYDLYCIMHCVSKVRYISQAKSKLVQVGTDSDSISISQASLELSSSYIAAKVNFIKRNFLMWFIYFPIIWILYNRHFQKISLSNFFVKFF